MCGFQTAQKVSVHPQVDDVRASKRCSDFAGGGAAGVRRRFQFQRCLGAAASQQDVYSAVDMPGMLAHALQGFSAMVFAFGATGSGKTHTVAGPERAAPQSPDEGLLPRAVRHAFNLAPTVQHRCIEVALTVTEVYQERVTDLLNGGKGLAVRQHPQRGFYAHGVRKVVCKSADHALEVLQRALAHRCVQR